MRFGMAILIVLTQLAGPWLCCCGPLRSAFACHPMTTSTATKKTVPTCPLCAKADAEKSEPKSEHTPKPSPAPAHGPCECRHVEVILADKGDRADTPVAALLVPVSVELPHVLPVESYTPADLTGLRELPHLTTSERLYAHHALRC